jgi:hypothetical protein
MSSNIVRFFLWDLESKLVLCDTLSATALHAVREGILNSKVYVSGVGQFPESPQNMLMFSDTHPNKLYPATITLSEKHVNMIKVAKLRIKYMQQLEAFLQKYVDRYCSPLEVGIHNYLPALALGEEFNINHPIVVEYSDILNIPAVEAYNDLKMRFDSYGLVKIKSFAFFEKFKKQLNQCDTETDAKAVLEKTYYELYTAGALS